MSSLLAGQSTGIKIDGGGLSSTVSISSTSAQSAAINLETYVLYVSVDCFVRQGANPTALSNGTDQFLVGGNQYRVLNHIPGNKLAFISTGSGTAYITPGG